MYDQIERISTLLRASVRKESLAHGLQPVQMEALHYLSRCNRYSNTPMAVSEFLSLTKGTVSQTLAVLESAGYLLKVPDPKDRRVVHLELTVEGERVLADAIPPKVLTSALGLMDESRKTEVSAYLLELLVMIQRANGLKSFGVCKACHHHHLRKDGTRSCQLTLETLSEPDSDKICREHRAVLEHEEERLSA